MNQSLAFSPTPFATKVGVPLTKQPTSVLQINLGRRCNLACTHCHVEAGPQRTEELSESVCQQLIELIQRFPQIQVVDLTGGAPEMLYGFRAIAEAARRANKTVIVRSNLTVYFEPGFEDIPAFCAQHQLQIVASLPCYLADTVNRMRGRGVYEASIQALQWLNQLGYGQDPSLNLDLVYNPPVPTSDAFSLTPNQHQLEQDYKAFLHAEFGIVFNHLLTLTNLPVGRTEQALERRGLHQAYLTFLETHFNPATVPGLMCRNQLSIDYLGNVYDCDFNQMASLPAQDAQQQPVTLSTLLAAGTLELIPAVQTAPYCYGCTAGSGSSCGGALL